MLNAYHHRYDLNYVGLRYMNVYGPRQDYHGAYIAVIMKMLDAIDSGESPVIFGDGSEAFDFVAVEDCAYANICAMKSSKVNKNYNVGTGTRTSLKELAEKLVSLTGSDKKGKIYAKQSGNLVKNRIGDPKLAANEIGYNYRIDLEDGLKRLIEWRKNHIELVKQKKKVN